MSQYSFDQFYKNYLKVNEASIKNPRKKQDSKECSHIFEVDHQTESQFKNNGNGSWEKRIPGVDVFSVFKKSERKSLEIFLHSKNLDDEDRIDLSPLAENIVTEYEIKNSTKELTQEKRVRFVEDLRAGKLTAEMRRRLFRESYSRINKNKRNVVCATVDKCEELNSFEENVDVCYPNEADLIKNDGKRNIGTPGQTSSAFMLPNHNAKAENVSVNSKQTKRECHERLKRQNQNTKRKLRSCRGRSFHTSLNIPSGYERQFTYLNTKIPKTPHPEIATMVSLVEQTSEKTDASLQKESMKTVTVFSEATENSHKANFQLRVHLNGSRINNGSFGGTKMHPMIRSQSLPTNDRKNQEKRTDGRQKLSDCDNVGLLENHHARMIDDNDYSQVNESSNYNTLLSKKTAAFHAFKMKECWSSFHKMSSKGVDVSIDTILRGLLTPTEYRLRKDEFLN